MQQMAMNVPTMPDEAFACPNCDKDRDWGVSKFTNVADTERGHEGTCGSCGQRWRFVGWQIEKVYPEGSFEDDEQLERE